MIARIAFRPRADHDIDDIAAYLFEESPEAAIRFYDAVDATVSGLRQWPSSGRTWDWTGPGQQPLRAFRVKGFTKYLLFYTVIDDVLIVVRVLHSARDIGSILVEEFPD